MKYCDWLDEWFANYVVPSRKERTCTRYKEIIDLRLRLHLGKIELAELTPAVLQKFVAGLSQNGNLKTGGALSSSSTNAVINVIRMSLRAACAAGYVDRDCSDKIMRPRKRERETRCFTAEEQKAIERCVLSSSKPKMRGVVLCLYSGLRIGELLALEWQDVDLTNGTICVTKSCHDSADEHGGYVKVVEPPKTASSGRTIPLPKQLLPFMREMKRAAKSKEVISDEGRVVSVRSYQRSFELLLRKAHVAHRGFHALRHTFATRALESGMDVKTLSEILGHRSPALTLARYVHSLPEHKREMMNRLGKNF